MQSDLARQSFVHDNVYPLTTMFVRALFDRIAFRARTDNPDLVLDLAHTDACHELAANAPHVHDGVIRDVYDISEFERTCRCREHEHPEDSALLDQLIRLAGLLADGKVGELRIVDGAGKRPVRSLYEKSWTSLLYTLLSAAGYSCRDDRCSFRVQISAADTPLRISLDHALLGHCIGAVIGGDVLPRGARVLRKIPQLTVYVDCIGHDGDDLSDDDSYHCDSEDDADDPVCRTCKRHTRFARPPAKKPVA